MKNPKSIMINDFATQYYTAGTDGPILLLVHGAGMDSAVLSWEEVFLPLSKSARVYAVDLPGYGGSEYKPDVTYSNDFYVNFLKDFMDALEIERAMLMGLSLGGGIVLGFSLTHPSRVSALGLVSSNGIAKKWNHHFITYHFYVNTPLNKLSYRLMRKSKAFIRMIVKAGLFYHTEHIDDLVEDIYELAQSPHLGKAFFSFQQSEYLGSQGVRSYFKERLHEITVPTIIIHGKEERTVPVAEAITAHNLIQQSELHLLDEARHWPQKEYPEKVIRMIHDFIQNHPALEEQHAIPSSKRS
ncbi:alpha/beta fold hydrolase [Alkalicoccobacillus porphyridii]|uniref:Alpha/beta hydrolase n=1 Tax=Alkalicoccobacillus porphyridii TaxID=2597270 RepID=A0A553ZX14_9BACI|nr:alpha/beta hydrolase [Alkalicoccobacillus porphyridii]TSB45999.1 alpha/beta hydrolase [Alkalicoccobacillus porphyridii]